MKITKNNKKKYTLTMFQVLMLSSVSSRGHGNFLVVSMSVRNTTKNNYLLQGNLFMFCVLERKNNQLMFKSTNISISLKYRFYFKS